MNQQKQKPLILRIDEAKTEIIQSINNVLQKYGLSCYFVEPILADIYTQIKNGAQSELEIARAQMNGATETTSKGEENENISI